MTGTAFAILAMFLSLCEFLRYVTWALAVEESLLEEKRRACCAMERSSTPGTLGKLRWWRFKHGRLEVASCWNMCCLSEHLAFWHLCSTSFVIHKSLSAGLVISLTQSFPVVKIMPRLHIWPWLQGWLNKIAYFWRIKYVEYALAYLMNFKYCTVMIKRW